MKKTIAFLAGALLLFSLNEASARAVKLGKELNNSGVGYSRSGHDEKREVCPTNCTKCSGKKCTACKNGYALENDKCVKFTCPQHASCNGTTISSCEAGYFIKDKACQACPAEHCSACNDKGWCTACTSGYDLYAAIGECITCPETAICENGDFRCKEGYTQTGYGRPSCQKCPTGCKTCGEDAYCSSCYSGYMLFEYPDGYVGCLCPDNAASCTNSGYTCKTGYYKASGLPNCTACPNNATCTDGQSFTCINGYTKSGSKCICASGRFEFGGGCIACPSNTSSCSGTSFTCKTGYEQHIEPIPGVENGYKAECKACASGYLKSGDSCNTCPSNATCNGTTDFTCKSGYRKSGTSCVDNCTGVQCTAGTPTSDSSGCCCK